MKNKSAKIAAFLVTLLLLLVFASTAGYSMISKSDKSITSSFDRAACDLEDYDGDGDSNFIESRDDLVAQPCPCDNNAYASNYGYIPRNSTFNRSNDLGPYVIFDRSKYKDELLNINWISAEDFEEMEMQLVSLKQLAPNTELKTSMRFSDTLEQYKKDGAPDKMVPSTFFCPKSCVDTPTKYNCCDLATFQKEWFQVGYKDFGLVGKCKTDPTECEKLIIADCAQKQKDKENGKVIV